MSTIKRLFFINIILFLTIGCGMAIYIANNLIFVRGFAEASFSSNERFQSAVQEANATIEDVGGLTSNMYDDFANALLEQDYYMIVVKDNKEIYFNLESSKRTKDFYKAFERSIESENKVSIDGSVMIYALQDPIDESFTYHIIDMNYQSFQLYENIQKIYLIALLCFALIMISLTTTLAAKEVAKPLRDLNYATHEIRKGNLDYEIKTKYKDEIGLVYKDIEALRLALKDAKNEREKMARDREEYIAGISHDLKTPLTSILGFSKGLIDGVADTKEKTDKYLKIIYDTGLHMNSLIEKLKEYSKIDSEKVEFSFVKTNMVEFINNFVSKNAIAYLASDVVVTSKQGFSLASYEYTENDYMAMIDVEEFTRVLSNILNNTVKYKHSGIAYSEIVISHGYGQIIISIKDDGPGVKEKELESIFNCFYRGDTSRTRPTEGSGLGLFVVYKIIAAHNGSVKAVNDNGLKIIITIPEVNYEKNTNH